METSTSPTFRAQRQPPGTPGHPPQAVAEAPLPGSTEAAPAAATAAPVPDAMAQRLSHLFRRTTASPPTLALKKAIHAYRGVPLP